MPDTQPIKSSWHSLSDFDLPLASDSLHSAFVVTLYRHLAPPVTAERRLWAAVIALAAFDGYFTRNQSRRADARGWIHSVHFGDVCDFAGVEPEFIRGLLATLSRRAQTRRVEREAAQQRRMAAIRKAVRQGRSLPLFDEAAA